MKTYLQHTGARLNKGFSLLEIITVIAVMSVVTTVGTSVFFKLTQYWKLTTLRMDMNAEANNVFAKFEGDINRVLSATLSGIPLSGVDDTFSSSNDEAFWRIQMENDQISAGSMDAFVDSMKSLLFG